MDCTLIFLSDFTESFTRDLVKILGFYDTINMSMGIYTLSYDLAGDETEENQ